MSEESCKALYAYNGAGGEKIKTLTFDAGEVIKVIFSGDTGWWEGEVNGTRGWFPASYVEKIQEADAASNSSEDWKEVTSETGELYYVNVKTNETSWRIPSVSDSSEERVVSKSVDNSASSSTNNLNGNSLHLALPVTAEPLQSASQPNTPQPQSMNDRKKKSFKSLPTTPEMSPSPVPSRSMKTAASSPVSHDNTFNSHTRILNGISFPDEKEAKEQSLLHPGKFSYCDYFWKDKVDNHGFQSGFSILYQKLLKGKLMCKEISDLFKAREAIEIQYAKNLATLANSVHAAQEEGTLGETLQQVKAATLLESKIHQEFANKLRTDICQRLLEQREKEKKELKKLESSISELRKQVVAKCQAAERAKQTLVERNKDLEMKRSSPKHTKDDVQKARRKSTRHAEDLTHTVDAYNKQRDQWFEDMVTSTLTFERHETARIDNVKALLSRYSKLLYDSNTKCHETCNKLNEYIKKTDPDRDRELWVRKHATGKVRPANLVL